jgi:NAD(P)-dependent dehydrogenase (short-subunit alcohol dehydrogenase family)
MRVSSPSRSGSLTGSVAVVTGGSRGIGGVMAQALAAAGGRGRRDRPQS